MILSPTEWIARTSMHLAVTSAVAALALVSGAHAGAADTCTLSPEQGGMRFPVERLDANSRCLIGPIVSEHTTTGVVGPVETPITPELFGFLLDRPIVLAALVNRLNLGTYKFIEKGERRYWVDDGEGTQGLLTIVYRDDAVRIFHLDGYHEGTITPMVKAKAVVFLRLQPSVAKERQPAVQSTVVAYTKVSNSLLAVLVRVLRPLIGEAVTRKLTRAIDVTVELGTLIAQDPERVKKEAAGLTGLDASDQKTLNALLHSVTTPASAPTLLRTSP